MRSSKASILLSLVLSLVAWSAEAADRHVRQGATGSGSGADWTNAYTTLPATLIRGDTYYVADGSYGSYTFNDVLSGTTPITIKKATESSHGNNTGWNTSYGDGQATFTSVTFSTGYYTIDGQVGGGYGSNWSESTGYGFRIAISTNSGTKLITINSTVSNITITHVDLSYDNNDGRPYPDATIATGQDAIYGISSVSNFILSYCRINRPGRTALLTRGTWSNITVEHCYFRDPVIGNGSVNGEPQHGEIWSANHTEPSTFTDITIRYNWFRNFRSTGGLIFSGGDGIYIYGNVFETGGLTSGGNGLIANWTSERETFNVYVYNNTVVNVNDGRILAFGNLTGTRVSYNNIIYNAVQSGFGGTHNYNASNINFSETNGQIINSSIFTNYAGGDYTLSSATSAGTTLSTPYNFDMSGAERGLDGSFDRGAYEFVAGGALLAPTNLRILP